MVVVAVVGRGRNCCGGGCSGGSCTGWSVVVAGSNDGAGDDGGIGREGNVVVVVEEVRNL